MTDLTWTPEREAKLKEMSQAGSSRAEMVAALGVSKSSVSKKLFRTGLREGFETDNPKIDIDGVRVRPRQAGSVSGESWDERVLLPYSEWKKWNRQRRGEVA